MTSFCFLTKTRKKTSSSVHIYCIGIHTPLSRISQFDEYLAHHSGPKMLLPSSRPQPIHFIFTQSFFTLVWHHKRNESIELFFSLRHIHTHTRYWNNLEHQCSIVYIERFIRQNRQRSENKQKENVMNKVRKRKRIKKNIGLIKLPPWSKALS